MQTITRRIEFDAGHRVLGHGGKCAYLHGHRYVAEITVDAPQLDYLSMVLDFSIVKSLIGGWINENWDHNILLHPDDPLAVLTKMQDKPLTHDDIFGGRNPYIMKEGNPTAENIAGELLAISREMLHKVDDRLLVRQVRVYETPNCWADAFPSQQSQQVQSETPTEEPEEKEVLDGKKTTRFLETAEVGDACYSSLPESSVRGLVNKMGLDFFTSRGLSLQVSSNGILPGEARCWIAVIRYEDHA